jgi:hypothetical protein
MAHTLKLDIYCFTIKERRSREDQTKKFSEFFRENFTIEDEIPLNVSKDVLFTRFMDSYKNSFNNEFIVNIEGTKALAVDSLDVFSQKNIIDGMMKGGPTGIEQYIYDKSNSLDSEETIEKSKVAALPYYFKLWVPFDSHIGVIMIQSYTDLGVNSLVLDHLHKYFGVKDCTVDKYRHVPQQYKENFTNRSKVFKVMFVKNGLGAAARNGLNPVFVDQENLKVSISISGFEVPPKKFWKLLRERGKIINSDLSAFDMIEDKDFETVALYKDEFGHQSAAKISKNFDILPTYFLSDDLKEFGKESPDCEKIRKHTNTILFEVKKEIGYTPQNVE